jgi:hypothetical protein
LPWQCEPREAPRRCLLPNALFAGVPVTAIEAAFDADRLVQVTVRFDNRHYPALLATLRERWGEPEDRSYRARAGMAGEFKAGVKLWVRNTVPAVLEQYAGKIERGALVFGAPAVMERLIADKRTYPAGSARDL